MSSAPLALATALFVCSLTLGGEQEKAASPDFLALTQEMVAAYRGGRLEDCVRAASALATANPRNYLPAYYLAASYSRLQDEERGALWLERTLEANHPQGAGLKKDRELEWLVGRPKAETVFRKRDEKIAARWEGLLRHQKFDFALHPDREPKRIVRPADYRGKVLAVLIVLEHDADVSAPAATALQAIRDDLAERGLEAVAIHLERSGTEELRKLSIARFRMAADWKGLSLLGTPEDLFPLEVFRFPAVVLFDAAGTPRAIEEGYNGSQASRYRMRAEELLTEKENAEKAEKEKAEREKAVRRAGENADGDPARRN